MVSQLHSTPAVALPAWYMPIVPEQYDRSPIAPEELVALEEYKRRDLAKATSTLEARGARNTFARLTKPIDEIFQIRHGNHSISTLRKLQTFMRSEMLRRRKSFWEWSLTEWLEILCPTPQLFDKKHGCNLLGIRPSIMDCAYLLAEINDLRAAGIHSSAMSCARLYFDSKLINQQLQLVLEVLKGKGYRGDSGRGGKHFYIEQYLGLLFLMNRCPYLEGIKAEQFAQVNSAALPSLGQVQHQLVGALQELKIIPTSVEESVKQANDFDDKGMAPEWYQWCMAWYNREVDLTPRIRKQYLQSLLAVGRWLHTYAPTIHSPEEWTEDIALGFRRDICTWKIGQYSSAYAMKLPAFKKYLGEPFKASTVSLYLNDMRRFFIDLTHKSHSINGVARKIKVDFDPKEVFKPPKHIARAIDEMQPRDIDLRIWAKLAIAAATLSQNDISSYTWQPLSFFRALGLLWVTSARRPNELVRLRLDCLRDDWEPTMLDEEGHPLEKVLASKAVPQQTDTRKSGDTPSKIFYLQIPFSKNRGPFWIWIPDYTAEAIKAWKLERPSNQKKGFDNKDQEYVDFLFNNKDRRVGMKFINVSLIPTLCRKAGVQIEDAKGRITGHRGRSSRLTLLRSRGVSLEDLAEYAGHKNTKTIRRYARTNPIQLHWIIKDADDTSRIIQGVIDLQAAAKGEPALRWRIGYEADGTPVYCANQAYHTCPHRLDCVRCGMFIGGEKARLLEEGDNTLPVESRVPMTPVEKCLVEDDQQGLAACRAVVQAEPAPKTPDIKLIFNPGGLSNQELGELAQVATPEALEKLRQALATYEQRLAEIQPRKKGRNALVGAQKKRIALLQQLIMNCEQQMSNQVRA